MLPYAAGMERLHPIAGERRDPRAALVVERSALRPWLRALTSERYRRVPVLAREELTGEQATGDMKEIDLWPESPSR